ncbi:DUF7547 family protein [Salinigranum salinum]|uniref:DUF7547 family protein n=1 Tax=Salinigranum salinum TaxID=1364937 RepID=UPI0012608CC4|nr:hypothetical protein [Salinigranum salinum]
MSRDPADDDLRATLDDLRATLDDLERALDADAGADRERTRRPAPPRASDVIRFTDEYTIPTVISILETTIRSLELLQGVLRLTDPDRRPPAGRGDGRRLDDDIDRRVVEGTERALDELRRVLTGTEEPADPAARDVLGDARALTTEIESLLAEARERSEASRSSGRRRDADDRRSDSRGVVIPVDDGGDGDADRNTDDDRTADDATDPETESGVRIDVDAELESIRADVRAESDATHEIDSERGRSDDDEHEDGTGRGALGEDEGGEDEGDEDEDRE